MGFGCFCFLYFSCFKDWPYCLRDGAEEDVFVRSDYTGRVLWPPQLISRCPLVQSDCSVLDDGLLGFGLSRAD